MISSRGLTFQRRLYDTVIIIQALPTDSKDPIVTNLCPPIVSGVGESLLWIGPDQAAGPELSPVTTFDNEPRASYDCGDYINRDA